MKKMVAVSAAFLALSLQADHEFEIYNKSSKPIWYVLKNGSKTVMYTVPTSDLPIQLHDVSAGHKSIQKLDLTKETVLEIFTMHPNYWNEGDKRWDYTFTPKKTIYVTWDDKEKLRPQTGPLKGLLGKTAITGFSLKNNVAQKDIIPSNQKLLDVESLKKRYWGKSTAVPGPVSKAKKIVS